MIGKKNPGWSDSRKIGESRYDRAHPAEMAKFMKIHGFNQIERARSPRSEGVSRSCWVFLTGFYMKFWDFPKKKFLMLGFFFPTGQRSRIFEKSIILNLLKDFNKSIKILKKIRWFFENLKIFDFLRIRLIGIFFRASKKNFFWKISKLHRNTFQEHPTTPPYGARNPWD